MALSPWLVYLATVGLSVDYNVTCPDNRFCQAHHKYQSPCPLWDCSACWWNYPNCTKTEEAPSTNCPYVQCSDIPSPSHSHVTTAVLSSISVVVFVCVFARYLFRRFWRPRPSDDAEAEDTRQETTEAEDTNERIPLLQRCRTYLARQPASAVERFRATLSARTRTGPMVIPEPMEMGRLAPSPIPSAPPAYEDLDGPIIRAPTGSLLNENYEDSRISHSLSSPRRVLEPLDVDRERRRVDDSRLHEVPLREGREDE